MKAFLHLYSSKFPVLPGESEEVINPGTYGKAFAKYLQQALQGRGYTVPSFCCEDWGWWVSVELAAGGIGLCCYREHDDDGECGYVCGPSVQRLRRWRWKRLGYEDHTDELVRLINDLKAILEEDPEIRFLGETDTMPF